MLRRFRPRISAAARLLVLLATVTRSQTSGKKKVGNQSTREFAGLARFNRLIWPTPDRPGMKSFPNGPRAEIGVICGDPAWLKQDRSACRATLRRAVIDKAGSIGMPLAGGGVLGPNELPPRLSDGGMDDVW